ncbi:MAG: PilZ domain-containing protein [Actinomycetota bacterium]|jgi:hypothetical protein|nr:PilZ domain-containing protein [Actinomycetota bacterium]
MARSRGEGDPRDGSEQPRAPVKTASELIEIPAARRVVVHTFGNAAFGETGTRVPWIAIGGNTDQLFVVAGEGEARRLTGSRVYVEAGAEGCAVQFEALATVANADEHPDLLERAGGWLEGEQSILALRRCADLRVFQRREWVRVPVALAVELSELGRGSTGSIRWTSEECEPSERVSWRSQTVNLSGGGAMVVSERELEVGSLVGFEIALGDDLLRLPARVVSRYEGGLACLEFLNVNDAQRRRICGYVFRLQQPIRRLLA